MYSADACPEGEMLEGCQEAAGQVQKGIHRIESVIIMPDKDISRYLQLVDR